MWVIENLDDAGEGLFACDAATKEEALRMHSEKNKAEVMTCEETPWIDLALVTGVCGESFYIQPQLKIKGNIADRTEQELIQCILEIYSKDVLGCLRISQHIAEKLRHRRTIIRERKKLAEHLRSEKP